MMKNSSGVEINLRVGTSPTSNLHDASSPKYYQAPGNSQVGVGSRTEATPGVEGAIVATADQMETQSTIGGDTDEHPATSADIYEVEKITGMRLIGSQLWYRVQWKGYSRAMDTWEPRENLNHCEQRLDEYVSKVREKKYKQNKRKKERQALLQASPNKPKQPKKVETLPRYTTACQIMKKRRIKKFISKPGNRYFTRPAQTKWEISKGQIQKIPLQNIESPAISVVGSKFEAQEKGGENAACVLPEKKKRGRPRKMPVSDQPEVKGQASSERNIWQKVAHRLQLNVTEGSSVNNRSGDTSGALASEQSRSVGHVGNQSELQKTPFKRDADGRFKSKNKSRKKQTAVDAHDGILNRPEVKKKRYESNVSNGCLNLPKMLKEQSEMKTKCEPSRTRDRRRKIIGRGSCLHCPETERPMKQSEKKSKCAPSSRRGRPRKDVVGRGSRQCQLQPESQIKLKKVVICALRSLKALLEFQKQISRPQLNEKDVSDDAGKDEEWMLEQREVRTLEIQNKFVLRISKKSFNRLIKKEDKQETVDQPDETETGDRKREQHKNEDRFALEVSGKIEDRRRTKKPKYVQEVDKDKKNKESGKLQLEVTGRVEDRLTKKQKYEVQLEEEEEGKKDKDKKKLAPKNKRKLKNRRQTRKQKNGVQTEKEEKDKERGKLGLEGMEMIEDKRRTENENYKTVINEKEKDTPKKRLELEVTGTVENQGRTEIQNHKTEMGNEGGKEMRNFGLEVTGITENQGIAKDREKGVEAHDTCGSHDNAGEDVHYEMEVDVRKEKDEVYDSGKDDDDDPEGCANDSCGSVVGEEDYMEFDSSPVGEEVPAERSDGQATGRVDVERNDEEKQNIQGKNGEEEHGNGKHTLEGKEFEEEGGHSVQSTRETISREKVNDVIEQIARKEQSETENMQSESKLTSDLEADVTNEAVSTPEGKLGEPQIVTPRSNHLEDVGLYRTDKLQPEFEQKEVEKSGKSFLQSEKLEEVTKSESFGMQPDCKEVTEPKTDVTAEMCNENKQLAVVKEDKTVTVLSQTEDAEIDGRKEKIATALQDDSMRGQPDGIEAQKTSKLKMFHAEMDRKIEETTTVLQDIPIKAQLDGSEGQMTESTADEEKKDDKTVEMLSGKEHEETYERIRETTAVLQDIPIKVQPDGSEGHMAEAAAVEEERVDKTVEILSGKKHETYERIEETTTVLQDIPIKDQLEGSEGHMAEAATVEEEKDNKAVEILSGRKYEGTDERIEETTALLQDIPIKAQLDGSEGHMAEAAAVEEEKDNKTVEILSGWKYAEIDGRVKETTTSVIHDVYINAQPDGLRSQKTRAVEMLHAEIGRIEKTKTGREDVFMKGQLDSSEPAEVEEENDDKTVEMLSPRKEVAIDGTKSKTESVFQEVPVETLPVDPEGQRAVASEVEEEKNDKTPEMLPQSKEVGVDASVFQDVPMESLPEYPEGQKAEVAAVEEDKDDKSVEMLPQSNEEEIDGTKEKPESVFQDVPMETLPEDSEGQRAVAVSVEEEKDDKTLEMLPQSKEVEVDGTKAKTASVYKDNPIETLTEDPERQKAEVAAVEEEKDDKTVKMLPQSKEVEIDVTKAKTASVFQDIPMETLPEDSEGQGTVAEEEKDDKTLEMLPQSKEVEVDGTKAKTAGVIPDVPMEILPGDSEGLRAVAFGFENEKDDQKAILLPQSAHMDVVRRKEETANVLQDDPMKYINDDSEVQRAEGENMLSQSKDAEMDGRKGVAVTALQDVHVKGQPDSSEAQMVESDKMISQSEGVDIDRQLEETAFALQDIIMEAQPDGSEDQRAVAAGVEKEKDNKKAKILPQSKDAEVDGRTEESGNVLQDDPMKHTSDDSEAQRAKAGNMLSQSIDAEMGGSKEVAATDLQDVHMKHHPDSSNAQGAETGKLLSQSEHAEMGGRQEEAAPALKDSPNKAKPDGCEGQKAAVEEENDDKTVEILQQSKDAEVDRRKEETATALQDVHMNVEEELEDGEIRDLVEEEIESKDMIRMVKSKKPVKEQMEACPVASDRWKDSFSQAYRDSKDERSHDKFANNRAMLISQSASSAENAAVKSHPKPESDLKYRKDTSGPPCTEESDIVSRLNGELNKILHQPTTSTISHLASGDRTRTRENWKVGEMATAASKRNIANCKAKQRDVGHADSTRSNEHLSKEKTGDTHKQKERMHSDRVPNVLEQSGNRYRRVLHGDAKVCQIKGHASLTMGGLLRGLTEERNMQDQTKRQRALSGGAKDGSFRDGDTKNVEKSGKRYEQAGKSKEQLKSCQSTDKTSSGKVHPTLLKNSRNQYIQELVQNGIRSTDLLQLKRYLETDDDPTCLATVCDALTKFMNSDDPKIDLVVEMGFCPILIRLLRNPSVEVLSNALMSVSHIVSGSNHHTQAALECSPMGLFRQFLDRTKFRMSIRKETCLALSNITACTGQQIQHLVNTDLFPALMDTMRHDDFQVIYEATWAVANATVNGTPQQIKYIVEQGFFHAFCDVLKHPDPILSQIVLDAITNVLALGGKVQDHTKGRRSKRITYAESFKQHGGLDRIMHALNHGPGIIKNKAQNILSRFFKDEYRAMQT